MDKKKVVCTCYGVTNGDLEKAVKNGAQSFKEVKKATKVACACGHCKDKAKKRVKKLLEEEK
ncbi:MAG: (2Fe-2S)-binding protein [Oscillospiraceae bacterium]|nr:(2Fe-2S)-binding protein [Oscillospiraceae bacterium]